jgi:hypothetical protein
MAKEKIIQFVLDQITTDIEHGDTEALEELLSLLYNEDNKQYFIGYLSESTINELGYDLDELYRESNDKYDE